VDNEDQVRELMAKLIQAVEASLATSGSVREALAELVKHGYEARLYFVASADSGSDEDDDEDAADADRAEPSIEIDARIVPEIGAAADGGEPRFELTKLDRDFLRSVYIRPEAG
jgi:hypothetical protein